MADQRRPQSLNDGSTTSPSLIPFYPLFFLSSTFRLLAFGTVGPCLLARVRYRMAVGCTSLSPGMETVYVYEIEARIRAKGSIVPWIVSLGEAAERKLKKKMKLMNTCVTCVNGPGHS